MEKITKKQERVFSFLLEYIEKNGYPPSVRNISSALKLAGPNSAKKFLDILERKKYIRRSHGISRAIEIIKKTNTTSQIRMVPILGKIAAGAPILAVENIESSIALDETFIKWENAFILRVNGNSMIEAHIENNDLVVIKPQPMVENGEIAAVLIGEEATVKRFRKNEDHILLEPANYLMKPIVIKNNEVRILGKVVAVIRQMQS